jgi:dsDNA-specific endonuclease/ATPase MutS2
MQTVHEGILRTNNDKAKDNIKKHLEEMKAENNGNLSEKEITQVQNDYYLEAKQKACERLAELYPQYITFKTYPK